MERKIPSFRALDALQEGIETVALWLIYPLIAVMVAEIIARYAFANPLPWVRDVSTWLFAVPFMLVVAFYYKKNMHISAEDLAHTFGLTDTQRAAINLAHNLILLSLAGFLFWPSVQAVTRSINMHELSIMTTWRPVLWPFRAVIPITLLLLGLQGLRGIIESLSALRQGEKA